MTENTIAAPEVAAAARDSIDGPGRTVKTTDPSVFVCIVFRQR